VQKVFIVFYRGLDSDIIERVCSTRELAEEYLENKIKHSEIHSYDIQEEVVI
jgi:hypothetical protein